MKEEVTYLWEKTEDAWSCPSCLRKKNDCQVVGKNGKVLKILVEHHDHMRDYVKQYVKSKYGSWINMLNMHPEAREELVPYLDSVKGIAERFPHTPMCIDCNEIEGKIKRAVSADKFFSFSASEIRRGYLRSPNNRHKFLDENIKFYSNLYQAIEERLVKKRKKFIEDLIDQAVEHGVYWGRTITLQNFFDEDTLLREFPPYTSSTEQKKAINRGEAVRHMASWTKNEETELFEMNRNGISVEEISKKLGRSEKAVGIRLQKISQINNEP